MYRICKLFTIESGHMLSKHPERCRFPHGHSRTVELILEAPTLDGGDMVCDFKWLKIAMADFLDQFDHALCINEADPLRQKLAAEENRLIVFAEGDPTTERMAKRIFDHLAECIRSGRAMTTPHGTRYNIRADVRVERVRVSETPSSWAEYTGE